MANKPCQERRPLWVRLVMREEMKRSGALFVLTMFGLLASFGLLVVVIESGSQSLLGALELPIGLASVCLSVAGAFWCWLSVRWVDLSGKWPEQPNHHGA
jgi:hypothetical protein